MTPEAWEEIATLWHRDIVQTDCFRSTESCFSRFEGEPASGYMPGLDDLVEKATRGD